MWWFEWYFGEWADDRLVVVAESLERAQELAWDVLKGYGPDSIADSWEHCKDHPQTMEPIITGVADLTFGGV